MSEQGGGREMPQQPQREPIFLLPGSVTAVIAIMVAIHLASTLVLNQDGYVQLIQWFAFWPPRILAVGQDWAVATPLLWTPISHAFLHGGWEHLIVNAAWFAIFATPVARRYGAGPMLAIFLLSAIAGAALFAVTNIYTMTYLIGASGGVAGLTGAAVRFIFQPVIIAQNPDTGERVAVGRHLASFGDLWRDGRARFFILIWVVLNAAVPLLPMLLGVEMSVAWQAHLGGFFAGLFLVGVFERRA